MSNNKRATSVNAVNHDDPLWYKDAVVYQLHLKSFFDANNDGIGDFAGLMTKLDYITELGVDTIWLLPFYPSPRRDDGYDIAEYRDVHPDYGDMSDVRRFIAAAHERGMRVITELVVNHTSDQHPWFQRARTAKPGSSARNFYVWSDNDQAYAGTRIIFLDTEKSNWTWDPVAGAYFWHRFYSHQPDLNYDNPRVFKSMLAVMHFWLDLGVDGLRLDAVPYLVEREGTSNENLPETHAVLRRMRADLNERYEGRMLLAEANQWPEDAQEYFGQGDQCHMSFNFPLMPRMYMAIAKEDRFPITDIMSQTPTIPENCQWAIFLRNHDELTLEMVTSSERDYLWEVYAADRRARLNLGIRRRLAPLMQRDRRRIELMNFLLLTMPGTPVLYYGDEIGMGDNIHLGDRDGVRTPMQWSADRNGGFSRVDPERLVLPPLMGNLYGYEAVNVEAQAGDAHSLLNWMRRMLNKRRQYRVFGRGTQRFLYPGNRKVLVYLREYEGITILCVANLSHTPQAVELDLAEFEGRVPVELMGGTSFPAIGTLSYLLTLPPFGFYWFELSTAASPPNWHLASAEQLREYHTLVLRGKTGYDLITESRQTLERKVLPEYFSLRRWVTSRNEHIVAGKVLYGVHLPAVDELYLSEMEAEIRTDAGVRRERYIVPLAMIWQETLPPLQQQLAIARARRGSQVGMVTDAVSLPGFALCVVESMKNGVQLESRIAGDGVKPAKFVFIAYPGLEAVRTGPDTQIGWVWTDKSNSSLAIDDQAVLKVLRRGTSGVHPEGEMTCHLSKLGFRNVPALLGEVRRVDEDGLSHTLMLLHRHVGNQGDAWAWTLEYLSRTLDDAALTAANAEDYGLELEGYAALAAAVGKRLAEMHVMLLAPSDDPAFSPEPVSVDDRAQWTRTVGKMLNEALDALVARREGYDLPQRRDVAWLLTVRHDLQDGIGTLAQGSEPAWMCRAHGDFHLGQVLVAQNDAYLIDFEGDTTLPLEERRRKMHPLHDVAGMLISFNYAATVAGRPPDTPAAMATTTPVSGPSAGGPVAQRREMLLERFRAEASRAFLDAYREVVLATPHAWLDPYANEPLMMLFLIEKAASDVYHEQLHHPAWLGVPLRGLSTLARRLVPPTEEDDDSEA